MKLRKAGKYMPRLLLAALILGLVWLIVLHAAATWSPGLLSDLLT